MDCLEGLKKMGDNSIDLIITDPPYGINIASNGQVGGKNLAKAKDYGKQTWDSKIPSREVFDEMKRVSKHLIIFGGNYFIEYLENSPCWIVWDKNNTGNFADCELAWTNFSTAVRKYKHTWNGMIQENMAWKEERFHPTQKPLMLFRDILRDYTRKGDKVCDPFMGGGTTPLACKQLGLDCICYEISKEYCDVAHKRLQQSNIKSFFNEEITNG